MIARAVTSRSALLLLACTLLAAGCSERKTVTDPELSDPPPASLGLVLTCTVNLASESMSCRPPDGSRVDGGPQLLIVGGQGTNVQLTSTNVDYLETSAVFIADVTVENLMSEAMGTPDGTAVTGVRVFFHTGPTVTDPIVNPGVVESKNHDGRYTCTGTQQPYHEYMEILNQNDVTTAKQWQWAVMGDVNVFVFTVFVEADTPTSQSGCKP